MLSHWLPASLTNYRTSRQKFSRGRKRLSTGWTVSTVEQLERRTLLTVSISGTKYNDLNGNGVRDSELIKGDNPDVVFVLDVSGSTITGKFAGKEDVGDINGDGKSNTILDGELAGFIALNKLLIKSGFGNTARVSLVVFAASAESVDMDAAGGFQLSTSPAAGITDKNPTSDIEKLLKTVVVNEAPGIGFDIGQQTNYEDALAEAKATFIELETKVGNGNMIFLSDGVPFVTNAGVEVPQDYTDEVESLNSFKINIHAFGAGNNAEKPPLEIIDPKAEIFTETTQLLDVFSGVSSGGAGKFTEPGMAGVTVFLDTDKNGKFDDGELNTKTDSTGAYSFSDLKAGTYTVREVVPASFKQTQPGEKGGSSYSVTVTGEFAATGKDFGNTLAEGGISGTKFNDLNGNGRRDSELIQGENPDVVFVLDVSGSTFANEFEGGTPVPDINGDGKANTVLDAELQAFIALNQQLIDLEFGNTARVSLVVFAKTAQSVDMNPSNGAGSFEFFANPGADADKNGILDIVELLTSVRINNPIGQGFPIGLETNYEAALQVAADVITELGTKVGNGNLIFLSDGEPDVRDAFGNKLPQDYTDEVQTLQDFKYNIKAYGAGSGALVDPLRIIDPKAVVFLTTDDLVGVFSGVGSATTNQFSEPGMGGVIVYVDLNNNQSFDAGEPSATTNPDGSFSISKVTAGNYILREVEPDGFSQTKPGKDLDFGFSVQVSGGEVASGFEFGNTLSTGTISGTKYFDVNGNGNRDTDLIKGRSPDVVFVVDLSDSTTESQFKGSPQGDINNDGNDNTILDAEIAGFIALNQELIDSKFGDTANVSIVVFGDSATSLDMNPDLDGVQLSISPSADNNRNAIPDVFEILASLQERNGGGVNVGAQTNYEAALQVPIDTFTALGTDQSNGNMVFLSDGKPNRGGDFTDEVLTLNGRGINMSAFGAGGTSDLADLRKIDGKAIRFEESDELLAVFNGSGTPDTTVFTEPGIGGVTIYLDLNSNGVLDADEPKTDTLFDDPRTAADELGSFTFTDVIGEKLYDIREVVPVGFVQTEPGLDEDFHYEVFLEGGDEIDGFDFGNAKPSGSLEGYKYHDGNENGVRDRPTIVIVLDVSASAYEPYECFDANGNPTPGMSVGDVNGDGLEDTVLDAQIEAIFNLEDSLIESGLGDVVDISLILMASDAQVVEFANADILVTPLEDSDGDDLGDLDDFLLSITFSFDPIDGVGVFGLGTGTNFEAALATASDVFAELETPPGQGTLLFLTDGSPTVRKNFFKDEVADLVSAGVAVHAFVMGDNPGLEDVQKIDKNADRLCAPEFFEGTTVLDSLFAEPGLEGVTIYIDANDNGELDDNELFTETDEDGFFFFDDLSQGEYVVREVVPDGFRPTFSSTGEDDGSALVFVESDTTAFCDFGNIEAIQPPEIKTSKKEDEFGELLPTNIKKLTEGQVDAAIFFDDGDSTDFNGGSFTATIISGGNVGDILGFFQRAGVSTAKDPKIKTQTNLVLDASVSDSRITTVIGTVKVTKGVNASVTVTFNTSVSVKEVNVVLAGVSIKSKTLGKRVVQFRATDPDKNDSSIDDFIADKTVSINSNDVA